MNYNELRQRKGIMLCYPLEERRLKSDTFRNPWDEWPVFVQPKLNGDRCRAMNCTGREFLFSSTERIITSVPHIVEELNEVKGLGVELDGELYKHGWPWKKINGIVSRTTELHPEYMHLEYHVFGIINENMSQSKRLVQLKKIEQACQGNDWHIKFVPTFLANNVKEVWDWLDYFISQKYEGIIVRRPSGLYVRKRSTSIMKFKPKESDWFEVVDYEEEHDLYGNPKGRLGTLILNAKEGNTFSVYSGLTDDERDYYWSIRETLKGKLCKVDYQHAPDGVPLCGRFSIKTQIIAKINLDNLIHQSSSDFNETL